MTIVEKIEWELNNLQGTNSISKEITVREGFSFSKGSSVTKSKEASAEISSSLHGVIPLGADATVTATGKLVENCSNSLSSNFTLDGYK